MHKKFICPTSIQKLICAIHLRHPEGASACDYDWGPAFNFLLCGVDGLNCEFEKQAATIRLSLLLKTTKSGKSNLSAIKIRYENTSEIVPAKLTSKKLRLRGKEIPLREDNSARALVEALLAQVEAVIDTKESFH